MTTVKNTPIGEVKFVWERSTKNTHRYKEVAPEGKEVIGTLYSKKTAVDKQVGEVVVTPSVVWITIMGDYGKVGKEA